MVRLPSTGSPARYQPGDVVTGTVTRSDVLPQGERVDGTVVAWVHDDPAELHAGRVQVATPDGHRPWVQADGHAPVAADATHPAVAVDTVTVHRVTCRCGKTLDGDTAAQAMYRHRAHAAAACS